MREMLDQCDRGQMLAPPNTKGRPYANFSGQFQRARTLAKIEGLRLKDARGAACRRFCEPIASDDAVADTMGWSPEQVRSICRQYVDRDNLAKVRGEQIAKRKKVLQKSCKRSGVDDA
ncbi:MAG: hypothetical protein AAFX08_04445 [Pseudomonadota bacterium]